jgi:hypothetical protein
MQNSDVATTLAELTESSLQIAEENAGLHSALDGLLEKSAEFVRRQAEIFARVTRMAEALTLNEGRQKDRAILAATLQVFSRECETEVSTHIRSTAAVSAMYRSARTGNDGMTHPGLFRTFPSVH